ncbi:hypothetical protein BCR39DRAFT_520460 [Naematelia encephala]|uniref:Peptide hydrolase n=1 Tax=Naematelia encephala TaxID=71784 RepID=A0A1Y2BFA3_9TREE|nr:hypothetical protein BCR39DRAFT_520460 [Naematelia encephala]
MLFKSSLLALPLLASAIPTAKPDGFTLQPESQDILADDRSGFSLDLQDLRLIQFSDDEPPVWITEAEKIEAKAKGQKFFDLTDTPTLGFSSFLLPSTLNVKYSYPEPGNYTKPIKSLFKHLKVDEMKAFLTKFSSFRTRYYRSETGRQSQQWLLKQLEDVAASHPGVSIKEFPHTWGQNSIIARFSPADLKDDTSPVTIISAHQDSTNQWPFLPSPGADDDGSGTTSIFTSFATLAAANFTPSTPVEFMWFSAEEGGLLGSQAVAKSYEDKGVKVKAMEQFDMTAWVKSGTTECVGIIDDYVDAGLTDFVEGLVKEYLDIPPVRTQCGYACSDHASFSKAGYQSAFAIESTFADSNHNIHTAGDTMAHPEFSFSHMREFSKLAIAFAIELGGWN